jgi:hypothetical protein
MGKVSKGCGRGLILRYHHGIRLEVLRKATKYQVRTTGIRA